MNKWSIDRYLREDNLLPVWVGANFRIPRLETYSFSFCANKKKKGKENGRISEASRIRNERNERDYDSNCARVSRKLDSLDREACINI